MEEEVVEPFYHVLEATPIYSATPLFSASSLDGLTSPTSNGGNPDSSQGGCLVASSHNDSSLSPQSPELRHSVPILSSSAEHSDVADSLPTRNSQDDNNNKHVNDPNHSSQSSVYYAQIIYDEYEKMKRDTPAENGSCHRVPLMINPVHSGKSSNKGKTQSNTSGAGSNTSVQTSGSSSSLKVFKRVPLGGAAVGTTNIHDMSNDSGIGSMVKCSPPNSAGSSSDQYEQSFSVMQFSHPQTLPSSYHRPSKSHTTSFGAHNSINNSTMHPKLYQQEFGTLSSRPVLPPPPPPPVPPFNHMKATSVLENQLQRNFHQDFLNQPRTGSFTLRDRPLPERPDNKSQTLNRHKVSHIPRSVTPEPSKRRNKKPILHSEIVNNNQHSDNNAQHFKTLPHPRKSTRENCMNLDWGSGSSNVTATPSRSKRKHSMPGDKFVTCNASPLTRDCGRESEELKAAQNQNSKFSSTFSTLKRLLKRDKTPSRIDTRSCKSSAQSPATQRSDMGLSVFKNSDNHSIDFDQDDELAYDIQCLDLVKDSQSDHDKTLNISPQSTFTKAESDFREKNEKEPLCYVTASTLHRLNRTQSLVDVTAEATSSLLNSKRTPKRPVRIISYLSQASGSLSIEDHASSSYASSSISQCLTTPVQYLNTFTFCGAAGGVELSHSEATSHQMVEFLSEQNTRSLDAFLAKCNTQLKFMSSSNQHSSSVPLLEFVCDNQPNANQCAIFINDLITELSHKFFDPDLTGIGPHMFYVSCPKSTNAISSSGFLHSIELTRPRLVIRWDLQQNKKLLVKPEPTKLSEIVAIVIYMCHFRSITNCINSILFHVNSSVLVNNFFKTVISNNHLFYSSSPLLVQCYIGCYLGWMPNSFTKLFTDCSKAVPSCNINNDFDSLKSNGTTNSIGVPQGSLYNSSLSPYVSNSTSSSQCSQKQQLVACTAALWIKLEKAKLVNEIFNKLVCSIDGSSVNDVLSCTPNGVEQMKNSNADKVQRPLFDHLHDRVFLINSVNASDISIALKLWLSSD